MVIQSIAPPAASGGHRSPQSNVVSQPKSLTPAEAFAVAVLDRSGVHYGIAVSRFNSFVTLITSWHAVEQRICILYLCDDGSLDIGTDRDEIGQRAVTVRHLTDNGQCDLARQIADEFPAVVAAVRVTPTGDFAYQFDMLPAGGFYL
jgi:hypothetical protein